MNEKENLRNAPDPRKVDKRCSKVGLNVVEMHLAMGEALGSTGRECTHESKRSLENHDVLSQRQGWSAKHANSRWEQVKVTADLEGYRHEGMERAPLLQDAGNHVLEKLW